LPSDDYVNGVSAQVLSRPAGHQTVYNWIEKYTALMAKYLDKITRNVSDTWRADELFVKVRGDMKHLYAMMDNDTRFWLAQEVADTNGSADIRPLFKQAKELAQKKPTTLITDGAFNFHSACKHEFRRENEALAVQHIRHVRIIGDKNNNRTERLNGEIRDRESHKQPKER
jgi:transposase-like protein